jgi:predicted DNA-binding transcriptional regulator AlpA
MQGDGYMLLLDYDDLRARGIKYTRGHLWRLWSAGKFPRPVKLSASRNCFKADEVDAWQEAKLAERDGVAA